MDKENDCLGISSAGVEHVEIHLPVENPWNFYQQLVKERPELDERLVFFHFYVNRYRRENGKMEKSIRETTYDLLEHILNEWVCLEEDGTHSCKESVKT